MKVKKNGLLTAVCGLCFMTALPTNTYAQQFDISWSGFFGSGSVVANATNEGSGQFLITSFASGTQAGLPISLLSPNTYGSNDNLVFPNSSPQLDNNGFAFSDGTNYYDIYWATSVGAYYECSSAQSNCQGPAASVGRPLVSFSLTPSQPAPEPSAIWLLGTGLLGVVGKVFRLRQLG